MVDPAVVYLLAVAVVALALLAGCLGACVLPLWWRVYRLHDEAVARDARLAKVEADRDSLDEAVAALLEWRAGYVALNGREGRP